NTTMAGTSSVISIFDEDMLVYDILSRIPAKSLMRFKCVSKPWCSLIRDPYFVDLHFTRSKTLLRFFIIIPQVGSETENEIEGIYYQGYPAYFKTTGLLSEESGRVASTISTATNLRSARCTDIIGGVNGLVCFVNNFTHDDHDNAACEEKSTCCYIGSPTYCFGYDPATKKHKCGDWNNGNDVFMVAFDVGSEKFRTIQISKFRSADRPSDPNPVLDRCYLLEVNGCVAILRRVTADTADLWIYEDSDKESTYKVTTMDSTDRSWSKNTITLPVHQIIMETHIRNSDRSSKAVAIYSYDLKKKLFKEMKISGIPSSVPVHLILTMYVVL
ncbi:hypothetical protein MKW92_048336, partial [Papaver armeniacum]